MASLRGRVIAVTGAASGIGLAFAKLAADRRAKLALADIDQTALDKLVSELKSSGVDAVGTRVNVASSQKLTTGSTQPLSILESSTQQQILRASTAGAANCFRMCQTSRMKTGISSSQLI